VTNQTHSQAIEPSTLPDAILRYLESHRARDAATAITYYADDATVVDDGKTYRGREEILAWLETSASEYTYTTELVGAEKADEEHFIATNHLEGNFPGGTVDLRFRFALHDGRIVQLTIAP
jgi:ketosteroid isomerase-like protein